MAEFANVTLDAARKVNSEADLTGKRALVVGGSSGCGLGVALVLARSGCSVTIVGRSPERGDAAADQIRQASPTGAACEFISCDVRSLANIKSACEAIRSSHDKIDFMSLSCTRGGIQGYKPTSEGYDERLLSMYLGRFAWVHALLPLLLNAAQPRVLSILSAGMHKPYPSWERDFLTKKASMSGRTFAAGFYNDCACSALARLHPKLTLIHAFPGFVRTNWYLELPSGVRCMAKQMMKGGKDLRDCGEWMAYPLLQPELASGGCFLRNEHAGTEKPTALFDDAACDGVWAKSVAIFSQHL